MMHMLLDVDGMNLEPPSHFPCLQMLFRACVHFVLTVEEIPLANFFLGLSALFD